MDWGKGAQWRLQANATASTVPDGPPINIPAYTLPCWDTYSVASVSTDDARLEAFRQRVKALDRATAEQLLLLLHEAGVLSQEECFLWGFVIACVKSAKE